MLVSILLHVIVFFALDQVKFVLGIKEPTEIKTREIVVRDPTEQIPQDFVPQAPPEEFVAPPPVDTASLLEDVDLLPLLKEQEVEMRPDVEKTTIAIAPGNPAQAGDPRAVAVDASAGLDTALDLPEFGRQEFEMKPAAIGQVTVDPGSSKADDSNLDKFTDDLIKKGAGGKAEKGALDGLASLDEMIGLSPNELLGKKTMLPSDLLFEFNRHELRESAKIGLQKLGLLLDVNPTMYCWIEGHTDLIGGDSPNLELSVKRAEAVKRYLVESMHFESERIITRGYGRYQPIITNGDKDVQAPNRRVEIKMRKTPPTEDQIKIAPPKAAPVEEMAPPPPAAREEAPPPKAVLVRPNPPRPVEVVTPPKAKPVEETPPPRARPVVEEMPAPPAKAIPVQEEEPVLRAQPVEE